VRVSAIHPPTVLVQAIRRFRAYGLAWIFDCLVTVPFCNNRMRTKIR